MNQIYPMYRNRRIVRTTQGWEDVAEYAVPIIEEGAGALDMVIPGLGTAISAIIGVFGDSLLGTLGVKWGLAPSAEELAIETMNKDLKPQYKLVNGTTMPNSIFEYTFLKMTVTVFLDHEYHEEAVQPFTDHIMKVWIGLIPPDTSDLRHVYRRIYGDPPLWKSEDEMQLRIKAWRTNLSIMFGIPMDAELGVELNGKTKEMIRSIAAEIGVKTELVDIYTDAFYKTLGTTNNERYDEKIMILGESAYQEYVLQKFAYMYDKELRKVFRNTFYPEQPLPKGAVVKSGEMFTFVEFAEPMESEYLEWAEGSMLPGKDEDYRGLITKKTNVAPLIALGVALIALA